MADEPETMAEVRARANSHDGCPTDIFDRALAAHDARIRRDAAREALDGYAGSLDILTAPFRHLEGDRVRHWRDTNYPEETP